MSIITILAIIALCLIGILHFYCGVRWVDIAIPTMNGERLINPGKIMTKVVGLVLFVFAFVAYVLCFWDISSSLYRPYWIAIGWVISAIFTLRSIGEFNTVGLFKKIKATPFAYYDTRLYTPFAVSMGFIFAVLAYRL